MSIDGACRRVEQAEALGSVQSWRFWGENSPCQRSSWWMEGSKWVLLVLTEFHARGPTDRGQAMRMVGVNGRW
jgi:hypothetical protein